MNALSVVGLTVGYGITTVLQDVQFNLGPGEIFALRGSNGTGKSTFLRAICGLNKRECGTINVAGSDLRLNRAAALAKLGYVAQQFALYEDLTAEENLHFYGRCWGLPGTTLKATIEGVIARFGLSLIRSQKAGTLSHGWKQRLSIASASCHNPALLLLDEVTAGLDTGTRVKVLDLLSALAAAGTAILLTTHYPDDLAVCTRSGNIQGSRLIQA